MDGDTLRALAPISNGCLGQKIDRLSQHLLKMMSQNQAELNSERLQGRAMEIISPGWFIWHALAGIAVGYGLRVFEHAVWNSMQDTDHSTLGFAIMIISPSLVVGAALGYISVVLLAVVIKDSTALSFSVFLLCAFWAFLSLDLRDFLRRR